MNTTDKPDLTLPEILIRMVARTHDPLMPKRFEAIQASIQLLTNGLSLYNRRQGKDPEEAAAKAEEYMNALTKAWDNEEFNKVCKDPIFCITVAQMLSVAAGEFLRSVVLPDEAGSDG